MNASMRLLLLGCVLYVDQTMCMTHKMDTLEALFRIRFNEKRREESFAPVLFHFFQHVALADEKSKQDAEKLICEAYYDCVKKSFFEEYGKLFEEKELDELLAFCNTTAGKKLNEKMFDIDVAISRSGLEFLAMIREKIVQAGGRLTEQALQLEVPYACPAVICFEEIVKKDAKTPAYELFEKLIARDGICVVKISTTWCPPCRAYRRVFEEVAERYKVLNTYTITYIAVDSDKSPAVAQVCKVSSIPTTIFFKDGKEVLRYVDAPSKEALVALLEKTAQ